MSASNQSAQAGRVAAPPQTALTLDTATLEQVIADYDRLTAGRWAEQKAALEARPDPGYGFAATPLAWATHRLQQRVARPGWSWGADNADAVATAHIAAFRDFHAHWSRLPRFSELAAAAAADGFSLHALAVFAAARQLAASGQAGAFSAPDAAGRVSGFRLGQGGKDDMEVVVQRLGHFEWPDLSPPNPAVVRSAVLDILAGLQGRVNARHPGIVVLSGGATAADFDQVLVDGINAALRAQGLKFRGVIAVAGILPKLVSVARRDQAAFGWAFYPIANPHPVAGHAVRIGSRNDYATPSTKDIHTPR